MNQNKSERMEKRYERRLAIKAGASPIGAGLATKNREGPEGSEASLGQGTKRFPRRAYKRAVLGSVLALAIIILLVIPLTSADIIIDKQEAAIGEAVRITILPAVQEQTLIIIAPNATYRFIGGIAENTTFIPQQPGQHIVRLLDANNIMDSATFNVADAASSTPNSTQAQEQPAQPLVETTAVPTGSPIIINAPVLNVLQIEIRHNGTAFSSRDSRRPVTYIPEDPGTYEVAVRYVNGSADAVNVTVTGTSEPYAAAAQDVGVDTGVEKPQPDEQFSIPYQESRLKLRTAEGGLVRAGMLWKRDGQVVQQTTTELFDPQRLDPGAYDLELSLHGKSLRAIRIKGLSYTPDVQLGIEELPPERITGGRSDTVSAFAIDPSALRFSSAEVTFTAQGYALYKCAAYDFGSRTCSGQNVKVMDLVPGQEYTIMLNSTDPLFSQSGYLINPTFDTSITGWSTSNDNANAPTLSWTGADGVPAGAADITYSTKSRISIGSYYQQFNLTIPPGMQLANISFGVMWRVSTFTNGNPGWINFTIQNSARTANYCAYTSAFSGVTSWARITLNTTTDCPLGNFVQNTNYTFRMQCYISNAGGNPVQSCRWDNASINVTYIDVAAPVLQNISDTPDPVNYSKAINITANVTDNAAVNTALVEINGANYTMRSGQGNKYYFDQFNTALAPGLYYYRVFANDTSGNRVTSSALNFTIVDVNAPLINITGPPSPTYTTNATFTVFFNVTDEVGVGNCSLVIDSVVANSTLNPQMNTISNLTAALSEGMHYWNITCNDTSNNRNTSDARLIVRDTVAPVVLLSTSNRTISSSSSIVLNYTPKDATLRYCSLWHNFNGTWALNQTDNTPSNYSIDGFGPMGVADGTYLWNVECYDKAGGRAFNATNYTITVDTGAPQWTSVQVAPASGATYAPGVVYQLNITWADATAGVDGVRLETNVTGALANVTPARSGSVYNYTFRDLPAGTYAYRWYANDSAGNVNVTQQAIYTIKQAAPVINLTLNGTEADRTIAAGDLLNITANTSAPAGGYVELYLDGVLIGSGTAPVWSLRQFVQERTYNVTMRYLATQNYTAANKSLLVTVADTTPPSIILNSPQNNSVLQPNVTFYFTPADNMGVGNCTLILDGARNVTNVSVGNAPNNLTATGIPEGRHNWTINCSDTSNNTAINTTPLYFIIDTVAPGSFDLLLPGDGNISSNLSPTFTWSQPVEPNLDNYTLIIDNDISFGSAYEATTYGIANTSKQFALPDQTTWYWKVIATDKAGNQRASSQAFNYTTDATPPAIALNAPSDGSYTNKTLVSFAYTPADIGGIRDCSLYIDGKYNQTNTSIAKGVQNRFTAVIGEGAHNWSIACADLQQNSGMSANATFTVDTTPPAEFTLISPENNTITSNTTPTYVWAQTVEKNFANYTVQVSDVEDFSHVNHTLLRSSITATSVAQSPALTDGTWYWRVIAFDLAGNQMIEHPTIIIDTTPPAPFELVLPANGNESRNTTPLLQWQQSSDKHFTNYTILVSDAADFSHINLTGYTIGATNTSAYITFPQNVSWYWRVVAYDTAGNPTNSTSTFAYTPDLRPPNVSLMTPGNGTTITTSTLVPFRFNVSDVGTIESCSLYVDGNLENTLSAPQKETALTIQANVNNGDHRWYVRCADLAGNAASSTTYNLTVSVVVPTQVLYESAPGAATYASSAIINISYANDGAENQMSSSVNTGTTINLASATLALNASGMLIYNNTPVSFSGVFSNSRSNAFYITWKLQFQNASGTTTICQAGDDAAGGTQLNTGTKSTFTAGCTNTIGDLLLPSGTNLTLVVDTYYNGPSGRSITHYWEGTSASYVSFAGYKLGTINASFANYTDEQPDEGSVFSEQCNTTCADGTCLDTQVYLQQYNGTAWANVAAGGNITLNASQLNPVSLGNINSSTPAYFGLFGSNQSANNSLRCVAESAYSTATGAAKNISIVDRTPPAVTLLSPGQGAAYPAQSITFSYSATDLRLKNCSLWGNWSGSWAINQSHTIVTSGVADSFAPIYLNYGIYKWNVQCYDTAGNQASAPANFTLNIAGDLEIASANISFSPATPVEGQSVVLFANVTNKANKTESGVTVQFWDGDPAGGGVQIGATTASFGRFGYNLTNVTWTASMGVHRIYVVVDALGAVVESDEANNIASRQLFVSMWQVYYGNITGTFVLGPSDNRTFLNWTLTNNTGNIYITDSDTASGIKFTTLQALGRNTTGGVSAETIDDFAEVDTLLGTAGFADSVNATYTLNGAPRAVQPFFVYGKMIMSVPVINSSGNFTTGILWDTDDSTNAYFDAANAEDIVFVTKIKHDTLSANGYVDYEIRIPARLKRNITAILHL